MKRLIKKSVIREAYVAKSELEKIIGYLVTRSSGLRLEKIHFDEIIEHFENNGGSLKGLKGKEKEDSSKYYEKLHNSIDYVLKKHKLKTKNKK